MDELREDFEKMMELYNSIKRQVRQRDKYLYERWKAGGFLVDHDIVSMYPDLTEVMEQLDNPEDEEDDGGACQPEESYFRVDR